MAKRGKRQRKRGSARRRAEAHGSGSSDYLKLPEGTKMWRPEKSGTYRIDILPYIAGDGNPNVDKGWEFFEYTFYKYASIGPNKDHVVALARTYKKKDPIAEHVATLAVDGKPDKETKAMIGALRPKERQLFYIVLPDEGTKPGELVFEYSFAGFGELLDERVKQRPDKWENFWVAERDDGGMTLEVHFAEDPIGDGGSWIRAKSIDFEERDYDYDWDELERLPPLESMLNPMSYDALKKLFLQIDDDCNDDAGNKTEEPAPSGKRQRRQRDNSPDENSTKKDVTDDEESGSKEPTPVEKLGVKKGDAVTHSEFGNCTLTRINKAGTALIIVDADGDEHRGVDPMDCVKGHAEPDKPESDDDDDWDDDDDDDSPSESSAGDSSDDDDDWDF